MNRAIALIAVLVICSWGCSSPAVEEQAGGTLNNAANNGKGDTVDENGAPVLEVDGDAPMAEDANLEESDESEAESTDDEAGDELTEVEGPTDEDGSLDDPFADALDINKHLVVFPEGTEAPEYRYPVVEHFGLGGTEFWQRWPEGHNPTFSYREGTEAGRRCMYASALRFEAIMTDAPEEMLTLLETSKWYGRFFNWNDDYTHSTYGDGRSARLWAWRTGLVKWISQTNLDGSCYLPTLEMVERLAETCQAYADRREGEIQGCRAQ